MYSRKMVLVPGAIMLIAVWLVSCGGGGQNAAQPAASAAASRTTAKKDGSAIKLAWIGKTLNNPWWISVADFAKAEADALGVELTIALPQEEVDLEKQVAMVESAIQQKVDAIIISAASSDGIIPSIRSARSAGIKVINFDTRISDPAMYDAFIGADDVYGAYKAGKYICDQLGGQGKVGLVTGMLAQSTGVDRRAGFLNAVKEYPGITVVENTAEWRSDLAANVTPNMLTANPDIKAIFACNDQMAVGMVSAAKAAGKKPEDLLLVGYDGILDAVNLVASGDLDAFVALPNIEEGQIGVRLAVAKILNSDYQFSREIICGGPLVTNTLVPNHTDRTIYEYATISFPLRGITQKGY